jgi:hypothetical protein
MAIGEQGFVARAVKVPVADVDVLGVDGRLSGAG